MSTTQSDCALARYYNNCGVNYTDDNGIGKFRKWCDINEYDTEAIED